MRIAFDTSVLVAALIEPHPHHLRAVGWLEEAATQRLSGECTWHAIAETWSVLTRLPLQPPVSPTMADAAVTRVLERIEAVTIDGAVYRRAMRRCSDQGMRSGALFDALHLVSAEVREVGGLVTFNRGDFERLVTDLSPPIIVPPDPPEVRLPPAR